MTDYIGEQYYDPESERRGMVVGMSSNDPVVVVLQYDDGEGNTISLPDLIAEFLNLPTPSIDSEPSLSDACLEGDHDFSPYGAEKVLNKSTDSVFPRCNNCQLSSNVLRKYLGHALTPSMENTCTVCESVGTDIKYDVEDRPICCDCWDSYDETWRMPYDELNEFVFYDPSCGWYSDSKPSTGKDCPNCDEGKVSLVSKGSQLHRSLQSVQENKEKYSHSQNKDL